LLYHLGDHLQSKITTLKSSQTFPQNKKKTKKQKNKTIELSSYNMNNNPQHSNQYGGYYGPPAPPHTPLSGGYGYQSPHQGEYAVQVNASPYPNDNHPYQPQQPQQAPPPGYFQGQTPHVGTPYGQPQPQPQQGQNPPLHSSLTASPSPAVVGTPQEETKYRSLWSDPRFLYVVIRWVAAIFLILAGSEVLDIPDEVLIVYVGTLFIDTSILCILKTHLKMKFSQLWKPPHKEHYVLIPMESTKLSIFLTAYYFVMGMFQLLFIFSFSLPLEGDIEKDPDWNDISLFIGFILQLLLFVCCTVSSIQLIQSASYRKQWRTLHGGDINNNNTNIGPVNNTNVQLETQPQPLQQQNNPPSGYQSPIHHPTMSLYPQNAGNTTSVNNYGPNNGPGYYSQYQQNHPIHHPQNIHPNTGYQPMASNH